MRSMSPAMRSISCRLAPATFIADRAFDAGREHVDTVADRRHPDVGEPRHFDDAVEFLHQLVRRHAGAPFAARLELDGGLDHFERRRVGCRFGATRLAEDARDFRHGLDQPVGLLQQFSHFADRNPGQGGRHVQEIAFVQRRHEFAAQFDGRVYRRRREQQCRAQCCFRKSQHPIQQRPVKRDQPAVERVLLLRRNAAPDQITHQHRNQRHRQPRRRRHRIGLGERERREHPSFLRLQRKYRYERQRDDQEREEQRRSDFGRGFGDDPPLLVAL